MRPSLRIALHEWNLVGKEPRFLLPFFIAPLLLVGVEAFVVFLQPGQEAYETWRLTRSVLLMVSVLASGLVVPLCADSFAGEKERNTLELLMCLPVSQQSLFRGKVLGIYPFPVLAGWVGQAVVLGILVVKNLWLPDFLSEAAKALILTPILGLFLCAFSTLVSLKSESVRGAAQMSSLAVLGFFFLMMFLSGKILSSDFFYLQFMILLIAGATFCLYLGRRRFSDGGNLSH